MSALQGEEWRQERVGSLGASCLHEVVAKTKSGYSASRANRMAALIVERLTGVPQETHQNGAMLWGVEKEGEAKDAYAFRMDVDVEDVGLLRHPTIEGTHASPDGLIGSDGLLECKCPQSGTHIETLLGGIVPARYVTQAQWQMACSGRAWVDYVSFDPRMPEAMRLFIKRIERDDKAISELEREVVTFLSELDDKLAKLTGTYQVRLAEQLRASAA